MGREAGQVWRGKTREHARPGRGGCGAAGLRPAPALHPLSRVPRILSGFGATGSAASSGRRLRWRGVINAPPPGLPQACGRGHAGLSARFVLVTARPGSGQRLSARLGLGTPEPSGPAGAQGTGRAAAGSGMRLHLLWAGQPPGSQILSPRRTFELRLDSLSPISEELVTASL